MSELLIKAIFGVGMASLALSLGASAFSSTPEPTRAAASCCTPGCCEVCPCEGCDDEACADCCKDDCEACCGSACAVACCPS